MSIFEVKSGNLVRKDVAVASALAATDTENILGGGAGATTNTQALLDALAQGGGGGGGTSNYDALSNRPQINGNTLTGNKTGANLGLVDAVTGKGLSSNDYTDADKAIVGGVTSALAGKVNTSIVGVANGIAELDATGKVPSSQLPSYVDDVVDGYYKEADGKFYADQAYTTEITGEAGKIYISLDTNIQYRWTGSAYSALGGALVLGETSSTAYRGDRGKAAYDFSQTPYTSNPAMDGTASAGSSTAWSRGDHVHPSDTSKADKVTSATSGHFAGLDASGNLTDSGKSASDIPTPMSASDLQDVKDAFNPSVAPVREGYSLTEREVGYWVDGKTLYQITVTTGGNVPTGGTLIQRIVQTGYDTLLYTKTA